MDIYGILWITSRSKLRNVSCRRAWSVVIFCIWFSRTPPDTSELKLLIWRRTLKLGWREEKLGNFVTKLSNRSCRRVTRIWEFPLLLAFVFSWFSKKNSTHFQFDSVSFHILVVYWRNFICWVFHEQLNSFLSNWFSTFHSSKIHTHVHEMEWKWVGIPQTTSYLLRSFGWWGISVSASYMCFGMNFFRKLPSCYVGITNPNLSLCNEQCGETEWS